MALGRGNGIYGTLIDVPGSSPGAKVYAEIISSKSSIATQFLDTTGPGDGGSGTGLLGDHSVVEGSASGYVKMTAAGSPYPYNYSVASGLINERIISGITANYRALLTNIAFGRNPDGKDQLQPADHKVTVVFNYRSTGAITVSGYATTPVTPASGTAFKVVNTRTTISLDKTALEDESKWSEVYVGVADTAVAEKTATAARLSGIATDPRYSLLKVNLAEARRWSSNILIVDYTAQRTNSQDRLLNPKRENKIDPELITDLTAIPVRFDPTVAGPVAPSIPSGLKLRESDDIYVDDHTSVRDYTYTRNDSKDDIQQPGTWLKLDESGLRTEGLQTLVFDNTGGVPSATIPSNTILREQTITKITADGTSHLSKIVYEFGLLTTIQEVEFPKTYLRRDPSDLRTEGLDTHVFNRSGAVPSPMAYAASAVVVVASAIFKETSTSATNLSRVEYTLAKQSTKAAEEVANTFVSVDPNGIQTKAIIAGMDNPTPTLPSGLGLVSRIIHQQPSIQGQHTLFKNEAGLRNTLSDITYPETISSRSSMDAFTARIATIIEDTGDTCEAIADTEFASFQTLAYGTTMTIERINDYQVKMVQNFRNPGILIYAQMFDNAKNFYATLDPSDGVVKAYAAQVRQRGSSTYWAAITPRWINTYVRYIMVIRMMTPGTTIPEFSSQFGTTNEASFLGLSAGTVKYIGYQASTNIGLSGDHPFSMRYLFLQDPNGFFDLDGWKSTVYANAPITPGYVDVATLGMTATIPAQSDFSVFIT